MSRRGPVLALAAVLAATGAAVLVSAQDSSRRLQPRASARHAPTQRTSRNRAPRRPRAEDDPVLDVARAYALAARNWNAASYAAAWRRELTLATSAHRRRLRHERPTGAQLAALRADGASSLAVVERAWRDPALPPPSARVLVWLDERTETAGQVLAGTTRNQLRLHHAHGRWRVSAFTIVPRHAAP